MATRIIPTNKDFFNYKNNRFASWLYCFMSSSATFHDKLYYSKQNFLLDLPFIKQFLGINDKRTINKYLSILKNLGYITEDFKNYYFPNQNQYIKIDKDLLYNLCVTKSTLTIQIFVYLANKMKMKREIYNDYTYNFTLKEIRIELGYSPNSQNRTVEKAIKECIQTLCAENYIDYKNVYVDIIVNGNHEKVPNYQLTYITDKLPKDLKSIKEEDLRANKESREDNNDDEFKF